MADLRAGYKQTEVGIIPKDWKLVPLGEVAYISSGGTPSRTNPDYWNGDIPWITTTQINFNYIVEVNEGITVLGLQNSAARIYKSGTLLMAMYGQGKTRGKVAFLDIDAAINQACAAIALDDSIFSRYVFFNLSYRYDEIRSLSNIGNQENLNIGIIESIVIPLPPPHEQRLIADALSEVDAEIAALDALIAKKRDLKAGAMQRLLTGEERLPGFSGEWDTELLSNLGDWTGGGTPSKSNQVFWQNGTIPWVSSGDVKTTQLDHTLYSITEEAISNSSTKYLETGAILIVTRSGILRKYLPVAMNLVPMAINQDIKALIPDANISGEFVLHSLTYWGSDILKSCLKTGTTVESIDTNWLKNYTIPIPPTYEEQKATSDILEDMDEEIRALEDQREKTAQLKQGMMQELLTGKTRLV